MKMKPVLKFEDGKIIQEEKVRTKKRAIQTLEKKLLDIVNDFEEVTLFVINGDHFEDGQALYKKLQEDCPSS
ncbi:DegV family protein, partial [Escherichia coli]|uniref:DegV family protein n=1 Tax=Escherichia coli TaxID=562 RepID=UPI0024AFB70A